MTTVLAEASLAVCRHCGLETRPGLEFCCSGCAEVHALLMARGLGHFYHLQKENSFLPPRPIQKTQSEPSPGLAGDKTTCRRFYLEGIHCLGCLWLLEKLPELEPGISSARLDMAHQILEVKIQSEDTNWQQVLDWISRLGYSAKPLDESSSYMDSRSRDRISSVSRLGVAAFCTGNIMLLTVSIYAGTDAFWSRHFALLTAALAVPVLTYSAWPLYKSALLPLRKGKISIDLAIVFAIFSGITMSAWSLARGSSESVYFDSLSMLVFLLLSSRIFLQRMRESLADESPALAFASEDCYPRLSGGNEKMVSARELTAGDRFRLAAGQTLPVDATLLSAGEAYFDLSMLTGESMPVKQQMGDRVEAGSKLAGSGALFRADAPSSESRLAKILAQIRAYELHRSPSVEFANLMGQRFVVAVLFLCLLLLLWKPNAAGLARALALAIVTCPCVLAFAIPLTLTRALQRAAGLGIIFRDAEKLEALAETRNIFFDKTGTLTSGEFRVLEWKQVSGNAEESKRAAFVLEKSAAHPVGKAITRFLESFESESPSTMREFAELAGEGVEGTIDGTAWKLSRSEKPAEPGRNKVTLSCEGEARAEITLGDEIRAEAPAALHTLHTKGYGIHLLSGDSPANTALMAERLGIPEWRGGMKPEAKAEYVSRFSRSLMVGDGANDAVAFRAADVSVAMQGAVELSLRHCDVLLTKPGLDSLPRALQLAQKTMTLVRRNFAITLAYNIVAGSLAIAGWMSPLLAAILMPLSALTVFLLTTWRTSRKDFA